MRKVKFIYNPSSGENLAGDQIDDVIALYQERGFMLVPHRLDFRSDSAEALRDIDASYDHALIAGGDGTVNYIVDLLKQLGISIPLGILPAGTANDFATVLGIPPRTGLVEACRSLLDGHVSPVDVGKANGHYFVNVFSCGLFTDISQKTPTLMKNTFGKLAYYVGGLGELSRFRRLGISIESDGGNFDGECIIFFVFNGRTAGNLKIAYLSEIDDGLLDVLIVKSGSPITTIQTLLHYLPFPGKHIHYPPGIEHFRCSRLTARCRTNETTDIDGQPGPAFPVTIECEKGGLNILIPKTE
ncbi:MAG: YegS/Rv2252/BmrU family lipid kinase [Rikenellaceae bacterium]|nr:YegS/Rv2252/BmrU family lipid kinase [Rikenellaceae bacterium]